jgi:hypothetical protein
VRYMLIARHYVARPTIRLNALGGCKLDHIDSGIAHAKEHHARYAGAPVPVLRRLLSGYQGLKLHMLHVLLTRNLCGKRGKRI